ncbi:hypothetical protein N9V96_04135, partial [Polaribacter sp.]|nr:hypothetical protein [Polaribacter sp.]
MQFKQKIYTVLLFLAIGIVFTSCNNPKKEVKLNIKEYLALSTSEQLSPNEAQVKMLEAVMPKESFQPAPKISNRAFWDTIAKTPSGKDYLEKANSYINKLPEVPISDSIYRIANRDGNRGIYKPRYYRTMDKLERFVLAECIENKGRFIPQIENFSKAILNMKSWLHPNHDRNNTVLEGKRVSIDLGARKFGSVLALASALLQDKLPKELREEIDKNVQYRIT